MFQRLWAVLVAAVVVVGVGAVGNASACEPVYQKVICYQTVTCYETKKVPYLCEVIAYDECGKAYLDSVVRFKEIKVAVTRKVPVAKYVRVCD